MKLKGLLITVFLLILFGVAHADTYVADVNMKDGDVVYSPPSSLIFVFTQPVDVISFDGTGIVPLSLSQGIFLYAQEVPYSLKTIWNFFISGIVMPGAVTYTLNAGTLHPIYAPGNTTNTAYTNYFILYGQSNNTVPEPVTLLLLGLGLVGLAGAKRKLKI